MPLRGNIDRKVDATECRCPDRDCPPPGPSRWEGEARLHAALNDGQDTGGTGRRPLMAAAIKP